MSDLNIKEFKSIPPDILERLRNLHFEREVKIMEVCGTHTVAIHRYGIHRLLPSGVKLISGPGCPVCVTPDTYVDDAAFLADKGFIIATFGDMVKVPGTMSSLEKKRAEGRDVRVVYSPMDALNIAKNTNKKVVFLAVGFETTVPGIAFTVKKALDMGIDNFFILPGNKIIPPAMEALINSGSLIDGFILPGHVSTVLGREGYLFLERIGVPGVISGFEPLDIVLSIIKLLELIKEGRAEVINNYKRVVRDKGNKKSQSIMKEVFEEVDSEWRGLGVIEKSGLELKDEFKRLDIREKVEIEVRYGEPNPLCRCGDVLRGMIDPPECPLFKKVCNPDNPVGPCMVSSEGSCSAWFWYG